MPDHHPIILTSKDFAVLETMVPQWGEPFEGAAETLRRKLDSAQVVFPADVPHDVVTLNSRVRFRIGSGQSQERMIVGGPSEERYGLTLQLLSPRGLSMIGNAAGDLVHARAKDGSIENITIEAVLFQPERRALKLVHSAAETPQEGYGSHRLRASVPAYFGDDDPGPSAA